MNLSFWGYLSDETDVELFTLIYNQFTWYIIISLSTIIMGWRNLLTCVRPAVEMDNTDDTVMEDGESWKNKIIKRSTKTQTSETPRFIRRITACFSPIYVIWLIYLSNGTNHISNICYIGLDISITSMHANVDCVMSHLSAYCKIFNY